METVVDIIGLVLILAGVFFMFSAALGVLRMPDFFTRLHPAGITDSLGAPLVLIGVAIQSGATLFSGKIILLILFMLITNPTACHALAKAALYGGLKPLIKSGRKR
jgi:multicomponent Na+:H+ antiporter subunit G